MGEVVWGATRFTRNRQRLIDAGARRAPMSAIPGQAREEEQCCLTSASACPYRRGLTGISNALNPAPVLDRHRRHAA
jgi:hypothetical protein